MSESSESGGGKARKRSAVKAATGQGAAKVKATIHLNAEADERLSIHAIKMGMDRSELVEWLITQYLRRWVVSDRGGGLDGAAGGDTAA
jgi:Ribbon-helix-helix protein, copG family